MRLVQPSVVNNDMQFDEEKEFPNVDPILKQVLSMLRAKNYLSDEFEFLLLDDDGNLLVSIDGTSATNFRTTTYTVTTSGVSLLSSVSSRKSVVIENTGAVTCYLNDDTTVTPNISITLLAGDRLTMERYIGAMFADVSANQTTLKVTEVY